MIKRQVTRNRPDTSVDWWERDPQSRLLHDQFVNEGKIVWFDANRTPLQEQVVVIYRDQAAWDEWVSLRGPARQDRADYMITHSITEIEEISEIDQLPPL